MKKIKYIILLIGIALIILGIILNNYKNKSDNILNSPWLETSGSLLIINNNKFSWYKDYNNLKDNYYKGTVIYKTLDSYNYDKEYIKEKYGNINTKLFYIIKLYPNKLVINKNKKHINSSYPLAFELILEDNLKEGILYSKDLLKTYEIIKYGN